ncbi:MAG: bifunctional diguanylate cyclase/phosphodiesterase [Youngiibacter sp.]|nr:bifunctional diguanylate cyclase/phosphodiesterase [Youngiibacter sp.]
MKKRRVISSEIRPFVMPIIGITVAFLALGSLLVIFSRQHYYSILEEETDNEVRMVTKSLENMLVTRNLFEPSYAALVEAKELEGLISGLVPDDGAIVQIVRGEAGVESGMTEIEGNKFYRSIVPVDEEVLEDSYIVILKPSKETDRKILRSCTIGILILAAVYIALLALMDFTLNRNRHLMMLAYYDHLTGLFNSYYLKVMLTKDLKLYRWNRKALMLIGISNLKSINLLFGYDSGDDALRQLAKRMQLLVGQDTMLFRFTEDRFVLYTRNCHRENHLSMLVEAIEEAFREPMDFKGQKKQLQPKIGIVEIDGDYENADRLLKDATISLDNVDLNTGKSHMYFSRAMAEKLHREDIIEKEISMCLENSTDAIYLNYQPQLHLATGRIVGFEALARMRSEELGNVSPVEFIDVAERKQLIIPLGNLVLKKACAFLAILEAKGYQNLRVAVNVSGIQLIHEDFGSSVMEAVVDSGIRSENLELEITESVLLDNFAAVNKSLKDFQENGIRIALDDFGTGYSSFLRLNELNVNYLKLDRYFVGMVAKSDRNDYITSDIISMAHKFDLEVIAEGVETVLQRDFLVANGCDIMQGYLFARPLSEEDALNMLEGFMEVNTA